MNWYNIIQKWREKVWGRDKEIQLLSSQLFKAEQILRSIQIAAFEPEGKKAMVMMKKYYRDLIDKYFRENK
jgi:hypothetical protein